MKPRTQVGLLLRALFLRQKELRKRLEGTLNGGKPGWNDDEPAVAEIASREILQRFFGSEYGAREIDDFMGFMEEAAAGDPPVDRLSLEMIIREALGEKEVAMQKIDSGKKFLLRTMAAGLAAVQLELDEPAVDKIITESERLAFERGWKPPLIWKVR